MIIGYARASTADQDASLQLDALKSAGVERVYQKFQSGTLNEQQKLARCLDVMRAGATLVVWRLDSLGRGLKGLVRDIL